MEKRIGLVGIAALLALLMSVPVLANGAAPPVGAAPGMGPTQPRWTVSQLVTLSVREAWDLSGRSYPEITRMAAALVELSTLKRGIALPDTSEAGSELGAMIRRRAEADPDQLFYVVVDSAVLEYAAKHPAQPTQ